VSMKRSGLKAKDLLATPGFSGQVLATLSGVTYLLGDNGEMLWLVRDGGLLHRRCIEVSFLPPSLFRGQNFLVEDHLLQIGGNLIYDLSPATEWKPPMLRPEDIGPFTKGQAGVRRLLEVISFSSGNHDSDKLISMVSFLIKERSFPTCPLESVAHKIYTPILNLAKLYLSQGMVNFPIAARALVGLGPGLTPACDDFLGGLLFAAHWLKKCYHGKFYWDEQPIYDLMDWAKHQTHPISSTILSDLTLGHGPESLHELVVRLIREEDPERGMNCVDSLGRLGHTTGWYMLAGLLTGMFLIPDKPNRFWS